VTERDAICTSLQKKLGDVKTIATSIEIHITFLTAYRKSFIHERVAGQGRIKASDSHAIKPQTDKLVTNKQPETVHA
jgi:hypothetical protein